MQKMWKSLKNICPEVKQILPATKRNHQGKMVSSKMTLRNYLHKNLIIGYARGRIEMISLPLKYGVKTF